MCACCYDRAWYAKYGGCHAIKHLMNIMPIKWLLEQQYAFLRALLFVMMDLTNEVSSGAIDLAKNILEVSWLRAPKKIKRLNVKSFCFEDAILHTRVDDVRFSSLFKL